MAAGRKIFAAVAGLSLCLGATPGQSAETLVFIRHGEKPAQGLGQLDCRGLNRALALPAVIAAKFGKPTAIFAPDPAKEKDDNGTSYSYVRPLATVEPAAVRFGLPVDARFGFTELDKLQAALDDPKFHDATVLIGWEHKVIDVLAQRILIAHGGDASLVPTWASEDFDGIYVVRIDWTPGAKASFQRMQQGLDGRSTDCPG